MVPGRPAKEGKDGELAVLSATSAQRLRPTLRGRVVTIRPGSPNDAAALQAILAEDSVASWWNEPEPADRTLAKLCQLGGPVLLVIEIGGEVAGGIQYHEDQDPACRQSGIDIFLATRFQGRAPDLRLSACWHGICSSSFVITGSPSTRPPPTPGPSDATGRPAFSRWASCASTNAAATVRSTMGC